MTRSFSFTKYRISSSLELLLLAAIAIGIILRIINLSSREFWYDEVLSLTIAAGQLKAYQNPSGLADLLSNYNSWLSLPVELTWHDSLKTFEAVIKGIRDGEPHPFLFYVSQYFWLRLFGSSEAAMRSLNALLSIGTIFSGYGLGRILLGHRGGLLLAALLATNPFHLSHSLNVRMYAPLVLWTTLSGCALMYLINLLSDQQRREENGTELAEKSEIRSSKEKFFWSLLLMISVAAGFMTFYLFAYWIAVLGILVIYLDRSRWWQHGWRLAGGILLTTPWLLWGTRTQLRNSDVDRFGAAKDAGFPILNHLQGAIEVLGINLLEGDWGTVLPQSIMVILGLAVLIVLLLASFNLWRVGKYRILGVALLMGILPLLLALIVDMVTGKYTLYWGWGRSVIFIMPGCLLLLAASIEQLAGRWRGLAASSLLLLYLTISVGDFSLRHRKDMQVVADVIKQAPNTPSLIAMSSEARGHVLRLAYYINPSLPVSLLAQPTPKMIAGLEKFAGEYPRIIWLDSAKPLFSNTPTTPEQQQQISKILEPNFQLVNTRELPGTMPLDQFTMRVYHRRSS